MHHLKELSLNVHVAIITQLVASGILSIKRAAVGATFDPKITVQLSNKLFFFLRKSAFTTHCEHSKILHKGKGNTVEPP